MKEMEFKVISKEKNEMVLEVINADRTLLIPLVEELNRDEMVEVATYHYDHPYLENPTLKIKVKSGKPQAAIKRAAKKLEKLFEELEKNFEKAIKSPK
ncbi:MAG TPA: DNA-directed RNA polymerase subunit L [Candidatus Aciduliprofundum boonei]|uniref:DNA-directed RNA polymerase subunit Rpo11 n=1 Tax=Candidatus Aciduliprofundum boonei TaxID=379547 RepID=A0A7J3T9U3_9ARCH|nr:DNA-directed RNA polymerase subunit L [Candidatus Aciduliprofundum boonei]